MPETGGKPSPGYCLAKTLAPSRQSKALKLARRREAMVPARKSGCRLIALFFGIKLGWIACKSYRQVRRFARTRHLREWADKMLFFGTADRALRKQT